MTLGKVLVGVTVVVNDGLFGGRGKEREGERGRGGELEEKEEGKGTRNVSNTFAERSRPFSTPTPTLSTSSTTVVEDDTKRQNDRKQSFVKETLPAASFLGLALIARGEIGVSFLVLSQFSFSLRSFLDSYFFGFLIDDSFRVLPPDPSPPSSLQRQHLLLKRFIISLVN